MKTIECRSETASFYNDPSQEISEAPTIKPFPIWVWEYVDGDNANDIFTEADCNDVAKLLISVAISDGNNMRDAASDIRPFIYDYLRDIYDDLVAHEDRSVIA